MVKVYTHGRMVTVMRGRLFMIRDKGLGSTIGVMVGFIKGSGRVIG